MTDLEFHEWEYTVKGNTLFFEAPRYILTNEGYETYELTDEFELGNIEGDILVNLNRAFFPSTCQDSLINKLCIEFDALKSILSDNIKEFLPYRTDNEDVRKVGAYRLYFRLEYTFILHSVLLKYSIDKLILTKNDTAYDSGNEILRLKYKDLREINKHYQRISRKIRIGTVNELIDKIIFRVNTEQKADVGSSAEHIINAKLIEGLQLRNAEFSRLVKSKDKEKSYEKYLKRYPWLLNLNYKNLRPLNLKLNDQDHGINRYTDIYFAEEIYELCDIWELKKPSQNVFQKKEYRTGILALTSEVSGALNQIKHYIECYKTECDSIYRLPIGYILVGNLEDEAKRKTISIEALKKNLKMYNNVFHDVKIVTYDQLVLQNQKLTVSRGGYNLGDS